MGIFNIFKRKDSKVLSPRSEEEEEVHPHSKGITDTEFQAIQGEPLKCQECSGHYVLREGKYGIFAGCSMFPECRSTLKLKELFAQYLEKQGINIYAWKKVCWKCHEETRVYSYYLGYQIEEAYQEYCWEIMGIGDIPYLDAMVSKRYPTVKLCYSKTVGEKYMANTCEHCGALQGKNYVVDDPHEIFDELLFEHGMAPYLVETLPIKLTREFVEQVGQFVGE